MDKRLASVDVTAAQSVFDESAAIGIAQKAVRRSEWRQHTPPLVGREAELLGALRAAECAHQDALRKWSTAERNAPGKTGPKQGRQPGIGQSGARLPLAPLRDFITVLKDFWERTTKARFGYEVEILHESTGKRIPKSAAARLVWEAVQYLEEEYTLANVGTVMRELQRTAPP